MEAPVKRRRTTYPKQRDRAQELLNSTNPPMGAAEIADRLAQQFQEHPGERQIRNWIKDGVIYVEPDSAPWTIAHAERPEDIPLVFEVVNSFRHPTWWISVATGRWIARLRRAYPGLEPVHVLDLAQRASREDALTFTKYLVDVFDEPQKAQQTIEQLKGGRE